MTALTQDRNTEWSLSDMLALPVAAGERIFSGSLVCSNEHGYAVPAADAAGLKFEGVALEQADNRAGESGDLSITVRRRGRFRFASATPLDQSALGAKVYAVDDQTVAADAAGVANDVLVGVIERVEASDDCWILIDPAVQTGKAWSPAPATTTTAA
jgi:hypothetical protein